MGRRVAIALSGGIDSIVLLDLLSSLRERLSLDLIALHVNHGLSPAADEWQRFCAARCADIGVPFDAASVVVDRAHRTGIEAHARSERYRALHAMARRHDMQLIALAHHADDQAETVLLQLLRGGAPRGLAAMGEWHRAEAEEGPDSDPGVASPLPRWRPLLGVTRADIVAYAAHHSVRWIDDESNADVTLRRNFLRTSVLPVLEHGFPDYRAALSRAGTAANEAASLLDDLARIDSRHALAGDGIDVAVLRAIGRDRTVNLLRHVLRMRRLPAPSAASLHEFARQALADDDRAHPSLDMADGQRLCVELGHMRLVDTPAHFHAVWRHQATLSLPHGELSFVATDGAGIAAARIPAQGLDIRPRPIGGRLQIAADRPRRTLKNLMQEARIPAALRRGWPMLMDGCDIVAIPGVGVGVDWSCPPDAPGWTVVWQPRASLSA